LINATLHTGAVASVHVHGGKVTDPGGRIEIAGTEGDLTIEGADAGVQLSELRLLGAHEAGVSRRVLPIPARYHGPGKDLSATAGNVARAYRQLAEDIRTGDRGAADFATGGRIHHLLDTVRRSAESGTRQTRGSA
jgi:predicted dehydrogenase